VPRDLWQVPLIWLRDRGRIGEIGVKCNGCGQADAGAQAEHSRFGAMEPLTLFGMWIAGDSAALNRAAQSPLMTMRKAAAAAAQVANAAIRAMRAELSTMRACFSAISSNWVICAC